MRRITLVRRRVLILTSTDRSEWADAPWRCHWTEPSDAPVYQRGRVLLWMKGAPDWCDLPREWVNDTTDTRSVYEGFGRFGPRLIKGWTCVSENPVPEAQCDCDDGVDSRGRKCPLCEGKGYVYSPDAWINVYRREGADVEGE